MLNTVVDTFKNLWFRDTKEKPVFINDTAVRIRAGFLLFIPIYMLYTLIDVVYGSTWVVDGNTAVDTYELNWDDQIIYAVEAVRRTYDYTIQTWVLWYALFEMISGMFVTTSRLSPTILIASFLAKNHKAVWKPLVPKRFAWSLGSTFIVTCLIFFNPEVFANWMNDWFSTEIPTTYNYMPYWIPLYLVWICLGFMWLETVLGFCVGCKIHALLVWLKLIEEPCEACNNIDWEEIERRHKERREEERRAEERRESQENGDNPKQSV
ncbi:DUF4395 domain-containing protein [Thiomicrorhabdus sp. zzn3]|uniref:DUF4395 domain-containing protein n=1 Tax=Thiomicrorhabdus sp. zzn3 TaxID=3039775 RepID=UPI00243679A2|nr:DUF4395 domain-containing protein [Thiomicrorhabdus sp. zzn3]MDG6777397.1 DUF4395 domain-containing protein [Thiomicrorhabdus sp. zzn3]